MGKQTHDIRVHEDILYVLSTKEGVINKFAMNGKYLGNINIFNVNEDHHHINSFDFHDGDLYISMFSYSGIYKQPY